MLVLVMGGGNGEEKWEEWYFPQFMKKVSKNYKLGEKMVSFIIDVVLFLRSTNIIFIAG